MATFNKDDFSAIVNKTHTEQAIWFLNGFWEDGLEAEAEKVWEITHQFLEVQLDRKVRYGKKVDVYEEEADLEEHRSHRLLEMMGETQTVMALRKRLSALDIDNNHRMAITEFLLDRYGKTPQQVIDSPQGDVDPKKLAAAQEACDASVEALSKAQDEAALSAKALKASEEALEASNAAAARAAESLAASEKAAAEAADSAAKAAEAAAKAEAAADVVRAAEAELQAAIDEIETLEKAKADKIAACQAIIDSDAGAVKKGKAVQEKEATLAEDPLPLRKAKITQGAALKKVTKARKASEVVEADAKAVSDQAAADKAAADSAAADAAAAKADADAAATAAAAAAEAAAAAKAAADAAEAEAEKAAAEAQAQLEEIKNAGGTPYGKIWWMERVMAEKKKFMK